MILLAESDIDAVVYLLAEESSLWYLAVPAVVIATYVMLRATRRRLSAPGNSPKIYAREQLARLKDQHDMKGDMEQLLVQLQELSRQINAQIDTRFSKLETSIRDADKRIVQLEGLLRQASGLTAIDTLIADDNGKPGAASDGTCCPGDASALNMPRQRIYELADEGRPAVEIAQLTGHSTGEIELLLKLRGSSGTAF